MASCKKWADYHATSPKNIQDIRWGKEIFANMRGKIDDEKIYYDIQNYEEANLTNGLIIDITADQFGEAPIYVGQIDCFHKKFDFDFAHDYQGINSETCCSDFRLLNLYSIIVSI